MRRIKLSRNPALRADFLAHMIWPNDEKRRSAFIELTNEASVAYLAEAQEQSQFKFNFVDGHYEIWAEAVRDDFSREVIDPVKRSKAIKQGFGLNALSKEINKHSKAMFLAGYTLAALITLLQHHKDDPRVRGGPGIKKAQEIITDIQNIALTSVESAWANYKTVSHFLCAALVLENCKIDRMIDRLSKPDLAFIKASQFYRLTLITFIPKRREEPLVGENELWAPPSEWECPGTELIGSPFPDEILDSLAKRTAR